MRATNRPLNIAFFIEGMSASGVDTSTALLAKELRKRGHRVTRFLPWQEQSASATTDEVVKLPALRVSRTQDVYWTYPLNIPLFEKFYKERFDLIHIHTNTVINLLAWQMAGAFKLPIVYTYHTMAKDYAHYLGPIHDHMGRIVDSAIESYDKLICERADAVVTPSAKAAKYLHEIGVENVKIIPNGIDLNAFHPFPSDWLHQHFGIAADHKILLFVGRLNEEKRPLLTYDCFRVLAKKRHDLHLVMVGEGALREGLLERAASDHLTGQFHLTGLVNYKEMPAIYNSADIWVSTSCSEVHPMVAIEASACGLPAICWQDEALSGVIEAGFNGYLVKNQTELVQALSQLLDDESTLLQMKQNATNQASRYRVETTAQEILAVYESLIDTNKHQNKPLRSRFEESWLGLQHKIGERFHVLARSERPPMITPRYSPNDYSRSKSP